MIREEQKEQCIVTVDIAALRLQGSNLQLAVIQRPKPPFEGLWVLPGGHLNQGETLQNAAEREWEEETHAERITVEQIGVFSSPGRDPRPGRYMSILFFGLAAPHVELYTSASASEAKWVPALNPLPLGFDHDQMRLQALHHFARHLVLTTDTVRLLPKDMTLRDIASLLRQLRDHLALHGQGLNPRVFDQ